MLQINNNVVFVPGAMNGAIYNFNNGQIFSVNHESCLVIQKACAGKPLSEDEQKYLELLIKNGLFNPKCIAVYNPEKKNRHLDLCWLEITEACNCKCLHCYEGCEHKPVKNAMSLEEWKSVICQVAELNAGRVVVIGGEPCIHPDIDKILSFASSKVKHITLFTNGTLMTQKIKSIISENNIEIKVSLYGHCAQVHDTVTQTPGSFDKLMQCIQWCKEQNIRLRIAVVIMKENEKYYNDIVSFLNALELPYRTDVIREVFGGTQSNHVPEDLSIINQAKRTKASFNKITKKQFDNAYYYNTCWGGRIAVTQNGNVLPCVFERDIALGNIRDKSIKGIIDATQTRDCWELTFDKIDMCCSCEYRFACKDCRPLAKASGSLQHKNPRCTYNPVKGEWE